MQITRANLDSSETRATPTGQKLGELRGLGEGAAVRHGDCRRTGTMTKRPACSCGVFPN